MPTEKILIAEYRIQGGLKKSEQRGSINYIFAKDDMCDKTEIALLTNEPNISCPTCGTKIKIDSYRSLRFTNPVQLKGFIMSLIKSYVLFSRQRKMIHIKNFNYHLREFLLGVEKIFRGG